MNNQNLKVFKWVLVFWTIFGTTCSLLAIIFSQTVAGKLFKQYYSKNTKFSNSDNKLVDEKYRKEFFKKIFTLIILISGAMDGKFSF
jgi:uncharacterized membrane protein YdjX (TVP38/TMEM64 family)